MASHLYSLTCEKICALTLRSAEQFTGLPTSGVRRRECKGYRPSNKWCPPKLQRRVQAVQLGVSIGKSISGCCPASVCIRCGLSVHLLEALHYIGSGLGKSCRWPISILAGLQRDSQRVKQHYTHRLTIAEPVRSFKQVMWIVCKRFKCINFGLFTFM